MEKRAVANITHASGDPKEASQEIANWFKPEEIAEYQD
jgi:nucleoside diphosphate kinase